MKIGIVTYWNSSDNYGQQLQCYALQKYLRKIGHNPYLIRYIYTKDADISPILHTLKTILRYIFIYPALRNYLNKIKKNKQENFINELNIKNKQRQFSEFRDNHISLSENIYRSLKQLQVNPPSADVYITGSDQVWSQLLDRKDNEVYFLNFGKKSIKRIAYAPSFAMSSYPQHLHKKLKEQLSRFDAISVREYNGINICQEVGANAVKVLDPTLLLRGIDYENLITNINEDQSQNYENFIFLYSLNIEKLDDFGWNDLKQYANTAKYKIIVTPSSGYCPGYEIYDDVEYDYATISKWLFNIKQSKFVVTPSFHGIVFSILFHKTFAYIPLKGKWESGNARILNLLKDLGLECYIWDENKSIKELVLQTVDWNEVENKLSKQRLSSISYLNTNLLNRSV